MPIYVIRANSLVLVVPKQDDVDYVELNIPTAEWKETLDTLFPTVGALVWQSNAWMKFDGFESGVYMYVAPHFVEMHVDPFEREPIGPYRRAPIEKLRTRRDKGVYKYYDEITDSYWAVGRSPLSQIRWWFKNLDTPERQVGFVSKGGALEELNMYLSNRTWTPERGWERLKE